MNSKNYAHELQKENSRDEQRGLEGKDSGWSIADPGRYRCITLITWKSTTVQTPRSKHAGLGESELPNEWLGESQVACRDNTRESLNPKYKHALKNSVVSTGTREHEIRQQVK